MSKQEFPVANPKRRASDYEPIEWLDMMLNSLTIEIGGKKQMIEFITIKDFFESIYHGDNKVSFYNNEFKRSLDKLYIDGFIKAYLPYYDDSQISISFIGLLHLQKGGYFEMYRKEKAQIRLQLAQTIVICAGTAIAGVYYLVELIKWIVKYYPFHCN